MKRITIAILLGACGVGMAAPAPYPITVNSRAQTAPPLLVYQANETVIRVSFQDGTTASDLTNSTPFLNWATNATAEAISTSTYSIVSSTGGVVDFTFDPTAVNYDPGRYVYEVGCKTTANVVRVYRQGSFQIAGSPSGLGVAAIRWTSITNGLATEAYARQLAAQWATNAATANLMLNGKWLSNSGGNNGIRVGTGGQVAIGTTTVSSTLLRLKPETEVNWVTGINRTNSTEEMAIGNAAGYGNFLYMLSPTGGYGFLVQTYDDSWLLGSDLGLGTTAPAEKLHVVGRVRIDTAPSNDNDAVRLQELSLSNLLARSNDGGAGTVTNIADIWANSNITAGANVTVGGNLRHSGESIVMLETTSDNMGLSSPTEPVTLQTYGSCYMGYGALWNSAGARNNAIGVNALAGSTGDYNDAFGFNAGLSTSGSYNNFFGSSAGSSANGSYNSFYGHTSGTDSPGDYNAHFGFFAGRGSPGRGNTGLGADALYLAPGSNKVAVGVNASIYSTGSWTTAIGAYAGQSANGESNVFVGAYAGTNLNGATNCILIGAGATTTGNNAVVIGNALTARTELKGTVETTGNLIGETQVVYAVQARSSAGLDLRSNAGTTCATFGSGGGCQAAFADGATFAGLVQPASLTVTGATALATAGGNVSIGTNAGVGKLEVVGSGFPIIRGTRTATVSNQLQNVIGATLINATEFLNGGGSGFAIQTATPSGTNVMGYFGAVRDGGVDSGAIEIYRGKPGTAQRVALCDSNNNWGLGLGFEIQSGLRPLARLDVGGSLRVRGGQTNTDYLVVASNAVLAESGGTVGIGTIAPEAKLHVNGSLKVEGVQTNGSNVVINGILENQNTTWDDIHMAMGVADLGGLTKVDFNAASNSYDYLATCTTNFSDDHMTAIGEFPHGYATNTPIHPHVHYVQRATDQTNGLWYARYRLHTLGRVIPDWVDIGYGTNEFAYVGGQMEQYYEFPAVAMPSNNVVSSIIEVGVWRDGAVASGTVSLQQIGVHYEQRWMGSANETSH